MLRRISSISSKGTTFRLDSASEATFLELGFQTGSGSIGSSGRLRWYDEVADVALDGRFRVACCLKCFDIIHPNCLIVFDDFLDRPQYHVVLDYYDVVEKTTDNRMVILRKKKHKNSIPTELISKYELINLTTHDWYCLFISLEIVVQSIVTIFLLGFPLTCL